MSADLEKRLRLIQNEYGGSMEMLLAAAAIGAELEREECARLVRRWGDDVAADRLLTLAER